MLYGHSCVLLPARGARAAALTHSQTASGITAAAAGLGSL